MVYPDEPLMMMGTNLCCIVVDDRGRYCTQLQLSDMAVPVLFTSQWLRSASSFHIIQISNQQVHSGGADKQGV